MTAVKEITLHPPHISIGTWWIIASIVTVLLLAVCMPLAPTRDSKVKVACIPLLGVVFLGGAAKLRAHDLETVLSVYSTATLAFPLGLVGRGKEVRKAFEDEKLFGKANPQPKLTNQLLIAVCGMLLVWAWLRCG
ncbi:hypothetical protein FGW37_01045 [Streptomyces rectiverticillatus]|uniref:hypothetical protein n=1 Tax=Streptomyces rectiverticillatus TaxID=173860 RepID=UPI0015C3C197|nr:hypothetical protein [Streptomyces rectiverticillatus]QLE70379.1 hypothetical protein FGW37_01045 [Streptomyces rectiverticillatus]